MADTYYSLCCVVAALFFYSGWLSLFGPDFIKEEFKQWHYPASLRVAVGVVEWMIAVMLLAQFATRLAILAAIAILIAVVITLLRHRLFMRLDMPVMLLALLAILFPSSAPLGAFGI